MPRWSSPGPAPACVVPLSSLSSCILPQPALALDRCHGPPASVPVWKEASGPHVVFDVLRRGGANPLPVGLGMYLTQCHGHGGRSPGVNLAAVVPTSLLLLVHSSLP